MAGFKIGDLITWNAVNGECSGRVIGRDNCNLGYLVVSLSNGRRMLVHENRAKDIATVEFH